MQPSTKLITEMYTHEVPYVFAEFQQGIGESHWLKRVKVLKEHIRGQPYLRDLVHEQNGLAFSLATCSELAAGNNGMLPTHAASSRDLYPAFAFMAQTLSIIRTSDQVNADEITKRIRGGLKNPPDLRAMNLELHAANHFVSRGHTVEWPEMNKTGTFDLLVRDLGNNGLEVECKSISSDKGRRIHRRDALDFFHLVGPQIASATKSVVTALSVVLTVPGRLPSSLVEKRALAKMVTSTLLQGQSQQFAGGESVRISEFDPTELPVDRSQGRPTVSRELVDRVTSTINREAMIIGTPKRGTVVLVVQSATDDEMLQAVFDTVADSAKRQLSGQRAGLFFVGFEDITSAQLVDLAEHDGKSDTPATALRRSVSKFLSNAERDHVVGVNFLSRTHLEEIAANTVSSRGSAYYFPRKESKFWHNDFEGLVRID